MVDEIILKKQLTSYFLEKSITAITKVITDVWRKGWARSLRALGLGLGDPLASLEIVGWHSCFKNSSCQDVLKAGETSGHCLGQTDGRVTVAGGGVMQFPPVSRQTQHLHPRDVWLAISVCESIHLYPKHDGRPGCPRTRFRSAAASSHRFNLLQDNLGTDKVLVRPAMTLHTWSRIVMRCISSNRCFTSMAYFDLKALAICWHCYNLLL